MVSSKQCLAKFGQPGGANESQYMMIWQVPEDIQTAFAHVKFSALGTIGFPKKIYINKEFQPIVEAGLRNVMAAGLTGEMKTWDGVYIIRNKRQNSSWSLHSWAIAFDINAATNRQGIKGDMPEALGKCFEDAGCDWGARWKGKAIDFMHFQIKELS